MATGSGTLRFTLARTVNLVAVSSGPRPTGPDTLPAEVRLVDSLSVGAEFVQNIAGFHETYPVITFGPKIVTNRHTFAFVVSNTQYMTGDSVVANTYRMAWKKWVLGFHITREIDL